MMKGKHFILYDILDANTIPDDFVEDGDTASGTWGDHRVFIKCIDIGKALDKGKAECKKKLIWVMLSEEDTCRVEGDILKKDVVDYTDVRKV